MTVNWAINRNPVSQVISTGDTLTDVQRAITWDREQIQSLGINAEKKLSHTITVTVTDAKGKTDKASTTITFQNRVYYGAAPIPSKIDDAFIQALPKSIMTDTRKRTFDINDADGYYTWYAVPVRLGACTFKSNGFPGGFDDPITFEFKNALGYSENYYVYRTTNDGLTGISVEVS